METGKESFEPFVKQLYETAGVYAPTQVLCALAALVDEGEDATILGTCTAMGGGGQRWHVVAVDDTTVIDLEAANDRRDQGQPAYNKPSSNDFVRAKVRPLSDVVAVDLTDVAYFDAEFGPVVWEAGWRVTFGSGDALELSVPENRARANAQEAIARRILERLRAVQS
jgi:hypothetical protein